MYSIFVSIHQFDDENYRNENDYCVFYSYSYLNNVGNGIILIEGIEQKINFNVNIPSISFYYPLFYLNDLSNSGKFIKIELSENSKALVNVKYNNNSPSESMQYYIYEKKIFLLKSLLENNCAINNICLIQFQIIPVLNGKEVTMVISLQTPGEIDIHIPKNKFISSYYFGSNQMYNITFHFV